MKFLLIPLLLLASNSIAQTIITGKVSDNNQALPGSSVYIKNSYLGTVTNGEGDFRIKIPEKYKAGKLRISSIGYQSQEINLAQSKSPLAIQLQKDTCNLSEVLVMPKDTLLALLRRAYGKIKDNYSDVDTRMKGFYRESYFVPESKEYLYFGEALLDVFKTPYETQSEGQVKILESRMNKHPMYDSLSRVMWYGGVQMPLYGDDVKRRSGFISPAGLKKYNYSIAKSQLDGRSAYKIEFAPKDSKEAKYQGVFYLDVESLAYLYFDYAYSDSGKDKRNKYLSTNNLASKSWRKKIKYLKRKEKYYLSYISDWEELYNERTSLNLVQFNEYLTTDISLENAGPIPFKEQTELRDIFYLKAQDYAASDWKDQTLIVPDSSLSKLMVYDPQEAGQLLNKTYSLPKGDLFKRKVIEIITKLYFDVDFETRTTSGIENAAIVYTPDSHHNFGKEFDPENKQSFSFGMKTGYKLNSFFDINFYAKSSIGANYSELNSLGFGYEVPLINRGRQLFLMCGVNYFFSQDGYHIGDFSSESTFKVGGKKFRADKIALYVGKKKQGISFDFGLRTKLRKFYSLFVSAGYQLDLSERDRLFIQEKSGFFLTRKKTDISLKDSAIQYFEDGVQTSKTSFDTDDFYLKAGIRFAL
ncbi:carboxypeptidase-like regulatory domain-containing protein [Labilibaculum manganireducens]|uniref:carboxypeptidase-like regulatory domain-containing protein n=1 Tax=Labilibaculum manganireducens TaxID=1940525 RepID=UPI0029F56266|nr:carboxypeptidase-like regulatory domain-containing protein [Labilibaculum manganireducens]